MRASAIGSVNGMPISITSAGARQRLEDLQRGGEIGVAAHHEGDEGGASCCLSSANRDRCGSSCRLSGSRHLGMSLSPGRKCSPHQVVLARFGASSITLAMACAGSSAGMMLRAWTGAGTRPAPPRRGGKVGDAPVSCSQECSGPMPDSRGRPRSMRVLDLAVAIHQQIGAVAVQYAGRPRRARRRAARSGRGGASTPRSPPTGRRGTVEQAHGLDRADAGDSESGSRLRPPASGRGSRADHRLEVAPSSDTDAAPRRCRCNRTCWRRW